MSIVDLLIIAAYPAVLLIAAVRARSRDRESSHDLLAGRTLTLPALVASLVSTWYGGILGIGEYTWTVGLANWIVFALPYYVGAGLFALLLASRARQSNTVTIPQQIAKTYGESAGRLAALLVFLIAAPGAYLLILGVLGQTLFGLPYWAGLIGGALFSLILLLTGGFRSVIRADIVQTIAMYLGFGVLAVYLVNTFGGFAFLQQKLPSAHLEPFGGLPFWGIAVWYLIALGTLTDPAFFQRCSAAKNARTAKRGLLVSIACWCIFDALSTTCGLYARALLPDLADPVASFPTLATTFLPVGVLGLFAMSMIATAQSTVDSYLYICGTTFGHDLIGRFGAAPSQAISRGTTFGIILAAVLAAFVALLLRSVVDIWYLIGSVGTPALLVPVLFSFVGKRRMPPVAAVAAMVTSLAVAVLWFASRLWTADGAGWLGLPPIVPGVFVSLIIYLFTARTNHQR